MTIPPITSPQPSTARLPQPSLLPLPASSAGTSAAARALPHWRSKWPTQEERASMLEVWIFRDLGAPQASNKIS